MTSFDFKETIKFAKNLERANNEFNEWIKMFFLKEAYRVVGQATSNTPVDTGALRSSWIIGDQITLISASDGGKLNSRETQGATIESVKRVGNELQVVILNAMEYASYVEYGTSKTEGRYMFTRSIHDIYTSMPARFNAQFSAWVRGLDVG